MDSKDSLSSAEVDLEIKRAAQLSITEISIGSIGHGFKIPFTGHVLSLNQLAFLLNVVNHDKLDLKSVFEVSSIAAVLKSFSPAGNKLGPMLSIGMQGFLFYLAQLILGTNFIGQIVGALFLSLWAFIQPLLSLFILYGGDLLKAVNFFNERLKEDYAFISEIIIYAVGAVILIKVLLAITIVVLSNRFKKKISVFNEDQLKNLSQPIKIKANESALKGAIKDLFRPLFLLSFLLMTVFIWQVQGDYSQKIWLALRPLAIAFVLFYLIRSPWVAKRLFELSRKSKTFNSIYLKAQKAFKYISKDTTKD